MGEFSKNSWAFKIIEANYLTLIETTDEEFCILSKSFPNSWYDFEQTSFVFNRHFLNYISSLKTFLDHQNKFLSNHFGKDSDELKKFEKKTSYFFDNEFAYRLLYHLRNYSVHCGFSILKISSYSEPVNSGKEITYIPKLIREDLLKKFNFGNILKPELESMQGNIEVFDLVYRSIELYRELNELVNSLIKIDKENYISKVKSILRIESNKQNDLHLFIINGDSKIKSEIPYHYLE